LHKSLRGQIENRCKHFNGIFINKACAAGISYEGQEPRHRPCFKDEGSDITCPQRDFPSPAEVDKELADIEENNSRMNLIYPLIARIKKDHAGSDWSGAERCPACGGNLHLSHASLNGHVWGKCETPNCVAWME
jgi:hypothetical protein